MRSATNLQRAYPLSPMQEGMLFASLLQETSSVYIEQITLFLCGRVDRSLLQESFRKVIQRYDALRTAFVYENLQKPRQVVLKERRFDLDFGDVSHLGEAERECRLEGIRRADRERGFDLARDPLLRAALIKTGDGSYQLLWSFHHIILDGWCVGIILNDLFQVYRSLQHGLPVAETPAVPYANYINWLLKQDREEGPKYWQNYLAGYEPPSTLPRIGETAKDRRPYRLEEHRLLIESATTARMCALARHCRVTVNTLFQTLWGVLLQKYNQNRDAVFGAVVSGRPPEIDGIESMVGLCINTVPVRISTSPGERFSALL